MDPSTFLNIWCSRSQNEQQGTPISDPAEGFVHVEATMQGSESMEQDGIEFPRNGENPPKACDGSDVELEPAASKEAEQHSEVGRLATRVRALDEQLAKTRDDNESLRGQVERLTEEVKRLSQEGQDKDSTIDCLKKELKDLKEPKQSRWMFGVRTSNSSVVSARKVPRKQVQYTKQPLEQDVHNVDAVIMGKVHERFIKKSMDLSELTWRQDVSQVASVVFCVYASRLGTDVEDVLPDLKNSPVILVILHPVLKKHATAALASAQHLLSEDIKSKVFSIVHFAFTKDQGLHNCKRNEAALKKLTEVLETFPGTAL